MANNLYHSRVEIKIQNVHLLAKVSDSVIIYNNGQVRRCVLFAMICFSGLRGSLNIGIFDDTQYQQYSEHWYFQYKLFWLLLRVENEAYIS